MSNTTFYNDPIPSGLSLVTPPASEPVTLAEAKLWIRQDIDDDDAIISSLISAGRVYAETYQKRQLMPATYKFVLDHFPQGGGWFSGGNSIRLPLPKLISVTNVKYVDPSGTLTTLYDADNTSRVLIETVSQPARISPVYSQPWPVTRTQPGAVQVTYVAGYANAAAVPESTKTAIKLLVAHWYRNREAVGNVGGPLELAVKTLLDCDAVGSLY